MTDDELSEEERRELEKRFVDKLWAQRDKEKQRRPAVNDDAPLVERTDEQRSRYVQRALSLEVDALLRAEQGERNDALNRAAFNLGQLIGANALDEQSTRAVLHDAAMRVGLTDAETRKTIESGIGKGVLQPRELSMTQLVARDGRSADDPFGTGVAELSESSSGEPSIEPPTDAELADFWGGRELLTHVQQYARARRASPWAVLSVVLARIVSATPPTVVLPPIVGGEGSLNLFVGLVGASGSGKGAAERVAAECVRLGEHIETVTTGSGEGIAHAYRKRGRTGGEQEKVRDAVLFSVPEIDTLSALGQRKGATLLPELRRGWSGEALGFAYADPTKRLLVEAHSYRMCLVAGIQPARAQTLLDDADGGTPQRFIWAPAADPDAPDVPPSAPEPVLWRRPSFSVATRDRLTGRIWMHVCETARCTIDGARLARLRGSGEALDGHLLLSQLKTAAALALADSRLDITDDDWQLADVLIRKSTAVRTSIAATLKARARTENVMRAEAEADRTMIVGDRTYDAALKRATRAIMRKLARDDGECTFNDVKKAVQHRDRDVTEAALDLLSQSGQLEVFEGPGKGQRVRAL